MSLELDHYLRLRGEGCSVATAADESGIGIEEAWLHEESVQRGELKFITGEDDMAKHDEPTQEPITQLAADTLRGGLRDAMLSWFKATPKPWGQMGEREQRDVADAADRCARQLVKQACQIIAASERPCIVAQLVEYKEKDGVEAKLKLPSKGEVVAALHEACGREVLVVTSGEEEFQGEAAPAEIQKDQPELGIGAEYEEAA